MFIGSGTIQAADTAQKDFEDPTLFAISYKKSRVYMFSRREPGELTGYAFPHVFFMYIFSCGTCIVLHVLMY